MNKYLKLNLDSLYNNGYYYTNYDVGEASHSITIKAKDKEKFLNQFAQIWREKAEELLYEDEDFTENDEY